MNQYVLTDDKSPSDATLDVVPSTPTVSAGGPAVAGDTLAEMWAQVLGAEGCKTRDVRSPGPTPTMLGSCGFETVTLDHLLHAPCVITFRCPHNIRNARNRAHAGSTTLGKVAECCDGQHFHVLVKKKNARKVRQKVWVSCESDLAGVGKYHFAKC